VYLKKGEFLSGKIVSHIQTHNNGIERDSLNSAATRIKMLTEADIPNSVLTISDDGGVLPVRE